MTFNCIFDAEFHCNQFLHRVCIFGKGQLVMLISFLLVSVNL